MSDIGAILLGVGAVGFIIGFIIGLLAPDGFGFAVALLLCIIFLAFGPLGLILDLGVILGFFLGVACHYD